jgi:hypothetical protein
MEIIPDKWIVVQLIHNETNVYKIFATWMGGYLDGDSWKLNSGIESVSNDDEYYYFKGYSGSVYKCHKNNYGIATSFTRNVVENFKKVITENGSELLLFDEVAWKDIDFTNQ